MEGDDHVLKDPVSGHVLASARRLPGNPLTFRQHDHGALLAGDAHPLLVKVPHVKVACSRSWVSMAAKL